MTCQIKFAIWSLIFYSIFNSLNVFEHLLGSWLSMSKKRNRNVLHFVWTRNPNFLFTSLLPFAIAHVCICRTKKSMNTCKISKSLSKFLWNFSFTKEEVCFPVNICLPIVTYSTFVFLERTRSRHWRTFTIVWSIRNYFFYFTLLFLLQKKI